MSYLSFSNIGSILVVVVLMLNLVLPASRRFMADNVLADSDDPSPVVVDRGQNWNIDNNTVYVNDSKVFASATPHTISGSDDVVFEFESKVFTGDVDFAWGFNQNIMKPTKIWLWQNYSHENYYFEEQEEWGCKTFDNVTSYDSLGIENYDNYSVCLGTKNNTYLYNITREIYDGTINGTENHTCAYAFSSYTNLGDGSWELCGNYNKSVKVWDNQSFFDWKPWDVSYNHIEWSYENMTDWYVTPSQSIQQGVRYRCKIRVDQQKISLGGMPGKYWFVFKPSSESLSESVSNDHLYALDPWYNNDWSYRKEITVSDNLDDYQTKITVSQSDDASDDVDCEGHCNNDFSDLRFACEDGTVVPYFIDEKTDGDDCTVWILNKYNDSTLYMYYGNVDASDASDGSTTFPNWYLDWTSDYSSDYDDYQRDGGVDDFGHYHKTGYSATRPFRYINRFKIITFSSSGYGGRAFHGWTNKATDHYPETGIFFRISSDTDRGASGSSCGIQLNTRDDSESGASDGFYTWAHSMDTWYKSELIAEASDSGIGKIYSDDWSSVEKSLSTSSNIPNTGAITEFYGEGTSDSSGGQYWNYDSTNDVIEYGGDRGGYIEIASSYSFLTNWTSGTKPSFGFGSEETPEENNNPSQSGIVPANNSVDISLTPDLYVLCSDNDGDQMNATWWSNSSSSWVQFASNETSFSNNTNITQTFTNATSYSTEYWWSLNLSDGNGGWNNCTYSFTTRASNTPNPPSSFTASADNRTKISLTWSKGTNADYTYIRYKQGASAPSDRDDGTFLYNDTGTSTSLSSLSFGTEYSFKAWSWNITDSLWSASNSTDSATTDSNNAPSFTGENPANNSGSQELSFTWNITINDAEGDTFNWSIECSNGQSNNANDDSNGSKTLSISGLSYDTTYKVYVNATDSYDWNREWYDFTTKAPTQPEISFNYAGTTRSVADILDTRRPTLWNDDKEYCNASRQKNDYIYIEASISNATSAQVNLSEDGIWDNATHTMSNSSDTWSVNISGISPSTKVSFDIYAESESGGSDLYTWQTYYTDGVLHRKYCWINCTPESITYRPLYLYDSDVSGTKYMTRHEHRVSTIDDHGQMLFDIPSDSIEYNTCGGFVTYLFNNDTCINITEINSIYYHIWSRCDSGSVQAQWSKTFDYGGYSTRDDFLFDWTNESETEYNAETYGLHTYNLTLTEFYDFNHPFNTNDVYALAVVFQTVPGSQNPKVISSRNSTSFIILNVPDNNTLNNTDWSSSGGGVGDYDGDGLSCWTELYINSTNPFVSDTDNDGVSDYGETQSGSDPNDYTDTTSPSLTWSEISSNINGSYSNSTSWNTISNTINGSYSNSTGWSTITSTINGSYSNTSVLSWSEFSNTINGSYSNSTSFSTISSNINGSYSNSTSFSVFSSTINGSYSNNTCPFSTTLSSNPVEFSTDTDPSYNINATGQSDGTCAINITNDGNIPIDLAVKLNESIGNNIHLKYNTEFSPPDYTESSEGGDGSWSGWTNETIDNSKGDWTSIDFDSNGHPHVAWADLDDEIYYAYRDDAGTWRGKINSDTPDLINSSTSTGMSLGLAIDSNDIPHILYINYSGLGSPAKATYYAVWNDTGSCWDREMIDEFSSTFLTAKGCLDLDSNDRPHVAYRNDSDQILYAYKDDDGVWRGQENTTKPDRISYSTATLDNFWSMTLDSNDIPHISWAYSTSGSWLYYATLSGGNWVRTNVSSETSLGSNSGMDTYVEVDSNNNPHICIFGGTDNKQYYFNSSNGNWYKTILEDTYNLDHPCIAINSSDTVFISMCSRDDDTLQLYEKPSGGSWSNYMVFDIDAHFGYASLAIAPNGSLGIIYKDENLNDLMYAYNYSNANIPYSTSNEITTGSSTVKTSLASGDSFCLYLWSDFDNTSSEVTVDRLLNITSSPSSGYSGSNSYSDINLQFSYSALLWSEISSNINGSYTNSTSWNTISNTINGSYSNSTSWTTITNTINGSYSNTTNWVTIDNTINGSYSNTTTWDTISSTINGSYSNSTSWSTITNTINGSYSNTTSWVTISNTVNGSYSNTTTWDTFSSTINGSYSNISVIEWENIITTINGSYSNSTTWNTVDNTINGSYSNTTIWATISSNINGSYSNSTGWATITSTINGSYSNTTSWSTFSSSINGSYNNNTGWSTISNTINGSYSNTTNPPTLDSFALIDEGNTGWDLDNNNFTASWNVTDKEGDSITLLFTFGKGLILNVREPTITDYDAKIESATNQTSYDVSITNNIVNWSDYADPMFPDVYVRCRIYDGTHYGNNITDSFTEGIDGTKPTGSIDNIPDNTNPTSITGDSADATSKFTFGESLDLKIKDKTDNDYWTGAGWGVETWIDISDSYSWSYDSSGITWDNGHLINITLRVIDDAGNINASADTEEFTTYSMSWQTVTNTINGSYSNTTNWVSIISTINGSYSNTTGWGTISSNINGSYSNTTSWSTFSSTINGSYSNSTSWSVFSSSINGSYSNTTSWSTITSSINGSYSNTSVLSWNTVDNTINGSYTNTTIWATITSSINGSYNNDTGWSTISNTINGSYSNTTNYPQMHHPNPTNNSNNQPITLTWNITIYDNTGNFDWNITCNNGQNNNATSDTNGSKTLTLTNLQYSTTYTIYVNTTNGNTLWNNQTYYFTTTDQNFNGDYNYHVDGNTIYVTPELGGAVDEYQWVIKGENNTYSETEWIPSSETGTYPLNVPWNSDYFIYLLYKNETLQDLIGKKIGVGSAEGNNVDLDEGDDDIPDSTVDNRKQWVKNLDEVHPAIKIGGIILAVFILIYVFQTVGKHKILYIRRKKRYGKKRKTKEEEKR